MFGYPPGDVLAIVGLVALVTIGLLDVAGEAGRKKIVGAALLLVGAAFFWRRFGEQRAQKPLIEERDLLEKTAPKKPEIVENLDEIEHEAENITRRHRDRGPDDIGARLDSWADLHDEL